MFSASVGFLDGALHGTTDSFNRWGGGFACALVQRKLASLDTLEVTKTNTTTVKCSSNEWVLLASLPSEAARQPGGSTSGGRTSDAAVQFLWRQEGRWGPPSRVEGGQDGDQHIGRAHALQVCTITLNSNVVLRVRVKLRHAIPRPRAVALGLVDCLVRSTVEMAFRNLLRRSRRPLRPPPAFLFLLRTMSDSALLQGATLVNAQGETRAGESLGASGRVLALYFAVR